MDGGGSFIRAVLSQCNARLRLYRIYIELSIALVSRTVFFCFFFSRGDDSFPPAINTALRIALKVALNVPLT